MTIWDGLRDCGGGVIFFFCGCDVPGIWMVALEVGKIFVHSTYT